MDNLICKIEATQSLKGLRNPIDLIKAIDIDGKSITDEDWENIKNFGMNHDQKHFYELKEENLFYDNEIVLSLQSDCVVNRVSHVASVHREKLVKKGDRTIMAAVGWTQDDGSVRFNCGGSIFEMGYNCRLLQIFLTKSG